MPMSGQAVVDCMPQRSTLHSFWRIESAPAVGQAMQVDGDRSTNMDMGMRCEDCDRALRHDDAMDVDEGLLEQETACAMCRRHVCDTCAVLGNERICLGCASAR